MVAIASPATAPIDRLALASLFVGIGAWAVTWFVPVVASVIAVGLGHFAWSRIKRSEGRSSGKGYALAGLMLGYSALVPTLVLQFAENPARLAIQTQPEQPFAVVVSKTAAGGGQAFNGSQVIVLDPGDYFVDVVPSSKAFAPKKLRVHLSGNQMLALPVVLTPVLSAPRPREVAEPGPEPVAESDELAPPPHPMKGMGNLSCSSKPAGAEVWVDGRNTGRKTPLAMSSALLLPAGKHRVVMKLSGRASAPQEVTIQAGETWVLKGVEIPDAQ